MDKMFRLTLVAYMASGTSTGTATATATADSLNDFGGVNASPEYVDEQGTADTLEMDEESEPTSTATDLLTGELVTDQGAKGWEGDKIGIDDAGETPPLMRGLRGSTQTSSYPQGDQDIVDKENVVDEGNEPETQPLSQDQEYDNGDFGPVWSMDEWSEGTALLTVALHEEAVDHRRLDGEPVYEDVSNILGPIATENGLQPIKVASMALKQKATRLTNKLNSVSPVYTMRKPIPHHHNWPYQNSAGQLLKDTLSRVVSRAEKIKTLANQVGQTDKQARNKFNDNCGGDYKDASMHMISEGSDRRGRAACWLYAAGIAITELNAKLLATGVYASSTAAGLVHTAIWMADSQELTATGTIREDAFGDIFNRYCWVSTYVDREAFSGHHFGHGWKFDDFNLLYNMVNKLKTSAENYKKAADEALKKDSEKFDIMQLKGQAEKYFNEARGGIFALARHATVNQEEVRKNLGVNPGGPNFFNHGGDSDHKIFAASESTATKITQSSVNALSDGLKATLWVSLANSEVAMCDRSLKVARGKAENIKRTFVWQK